MKWFLTELKKHFDSWLLIIFASLIVVVVVSVILMSLSKAAIFPKDNERYDVDTIYVGQMKDFCPKEFAANPGRKEFEACVSKLDINKMVEIKIPTFKETLDKSPKVSEYFKQGNYFVTGIKIPDKYFTLDEGYIKDGRTNYKTFNYNMLTFKGVGFGIACVNDSCKDLLNMLVDDVSQIPLIRTNGNKGNIVWIFGLDNTNSRGLWLEDGILISKASTFLPVRNFYDISAYGRPIFVSIAFVALFLVSLPFAVYLRKFYEYPAFSYFAGSTALWFALLNLTIFTSWLSETGSNPLSDVPAFVIALHPERDQVTIPLRQRATLASPL